MKKNVKKSVLAAVGATVVAAGATIVAAKKRCNNISDSEETGIYGREKDYTVISLSELLEATKKR